MRIFLATLCLFFMTTADAAAQTYYLYVDQMLNFGSFGLPRNDAPYAIQVDPDGTVTDDAGIIRATPAQRGEIRFDELPENIDYFIGVDTPNTPIEGGLTVDNPTTLDLPGSGGFFILSNVTATGPNGENYLRTDGNGAGIIYVGGTLTTSGNNQRFESGTYTGTFTLTIYY